MKPLPVLLTGLCLAGAVALGGCSSTPAPEPAGGVARADADIHLELAAAEVAEGRLGEALGRLLALRELEGLEPSARVRCEELLDDAARQLITRLQEPEFSSEDLIQIFKLELPKGLRARAGILAAERMFAEGSRVSSYKQIKKVDRELPTHPERALAGSVLARIGLNLIHDNGRYYLFFKYRARGADALEYLVVRYPLDPSCPEAYAELARYYEDTGEPDYAIERHEDLLVYHPQSAYAVSSAARLPRLRLQRLPRNDYDRRELEIARTEVARWLGRYAGNELEGEMRALGVEVERRIVANDMILARYYDRIDSTFGSRIHAERALQAAENAGLDAEAGEARALLASLPREPGQWTVDVPETEEETP